MWVKKFGVAPTILMNEKNFYKGFLKMKKYNPLDIEISKASHSDIITTSEPTFDIGSGIWGDNINSISEIDVNILTSPRGSYEGVN